MENIIFDNSRTVTKILFEKYQKVKIFCNIFPIIKISRGASNNIITKREVTDIKKIRGN